MKQYMAQLLLFMVTTPSSLNFKNISFIKTNFNKYIFTIL